MKEEREKRGAKKREERRETRRGRARYTTQKPERVREGLNIIEGLECPAGSNPLTRTQ